MSANSNVKGVAGKVAHTCRAGDAPAMLAIGSSCINQAVKAIAIARGGRRAGADGASRLACAPARLRGRGGARLCVKATWSQGGCSHATRTHAAPSTPSPPRVRKPRPPGYLANDGHDLTFQTAFREGGTPEKPSVALYMAKHPLGWPITPNNVEMQVSPSAPRPNGP